MVVTDRMVVEFLFFLYIFLLIESVAAFFLFPKWEKIMNRFPWPGLWVLFFVSYPIIVGKIFHLFERGVADRVLFVL